MAMEDATLVKYNNASYVLRSQADAGSAGSREFPLRGEMLVGREAECAIPLDSSHISRYHAKINVATNGVYIEDLHSTNGTFVNGQRIKGRVRLSLGDEISFDDLGFRLASLESGGEGDTLLSMPAAQDTAYRASNRAAAPPANPIFYPSYTSRDEPEIPEPGYSSPLTPEVLDEVDEMLEPEREQPILSKARAVPHRTALDSNEERIDSFEDTDSADQTQFISDVRLDELVARSRGHQYDLNVGTGPRVIILSAPLRGKWFELSSAPLGKTWQIGRDPKADICLSDKTISTDHARLTKTAEGYQLTSTHAKNGLLINAQSKKKAFLKHNDRIQIGGTELVFRNDEADIEPRPIRAPDEQSQVWHYTVMGLTILVVAAITALFAMGG